MSLFREINTPYRDEHDAQLSYFQEIIENFLSRLKPGSKNDKFITLIARSADAPVARALALYSDEINRLGLNCRAIFAQLGPAELMSEWVEPHSGPCGQQAGKNMRWAKQPSLLDAHEQLVLGALTSWSGDAMRREPSARYSIYLFEDNCAKSAQLGLKAFEALWNASSPMPRGTMKQCKSYSDQLNLDFTQTGDKTLGLSLNSISMPAHTRH